MLAVLNADVDLLGEYAVLDPLVDNDADGPAAHVVDPTGFAVVRLVRHTLVHVTSALRGKKSR